LNSTIKSGVECRVSSSGCRVGATRPALRRLEGRVAPTPETPHLKRHTRNPGPSRVAGFTLLELIVVLFILALAAALVAPVFTRSFGQLRLKAAARDLAALCRFARTQAIANQVVLEVVLDRGANAYWLRGPEWVVSRLGGIEQVATAEDPEQPWQVRLRQARVRPLPVGVTLKSVILDPGTLREDERGAIVFFPQGSSSGGEVWVSDEKGRGYRIVIDPSIGVVRIHQGLAT
jgi:prepilin-type N-terminal cleavage/methylation domain-containing protein